MKKAALVFCFVGLFAVMSFGQGRTVDNFTLEKYKQQRLAAERDYRENYERMGFPSPEELDRQREADMATRAELSQQLRDARLEKERLELAQRGLSLEAARLDAEMQAQADQSTGYYGGYFTNGFGYGGFGRRGFGSRGRHGRFGGLPTISNYPKNRLTPFVDRGAYRVTPFGVIQTPNPRPAIVIRGRARRYR